MREIREYIKYPFCIAVNYLQLPAMVEDKVYLEFRK